MSTADVIRKFRTRVERGELADLEVVYRVAGGMPAEKQFDDEVRLSGKKKVSARSTTLPGKSREVSTRLKETQIMMLFQQVGESLDGLVPQDQARFLPDSLIGSITLRVAGEETTLFFNADEEARQARASSSTAERVNGITSLDRLTQTLLYEKDE